MNKEISSPLRDTACTVMSVKAENNAPRSANTYDSGHGT